MPLPLNIAARRGLTAAALGLALSGASLLASAPAANAAFTLAPCTGTGITGAGSTFQNSAQNYWRSPAVFGSSNAPGCGGAPGGAPPIGYTGGGSGKGLTSFGANGGPRPMDSNRFVGTDDPPSPTQQANINGGSANGTDSGTVHVLPVAGGAATVIVHFPEGCALKDPGSSGGNDNASTGGPNDPSGQPTGDSAANNTLRVHISNATLEKIFEHAPGGLTWGDVVPAAADLTGKPTNPLNAGAGSGSCAAVPIRRIVRQDTSGTTFTFKNYLSLVAPTFGWTGPTYANPNTVWPQVKGGNNTPPQPDGFAGNPNTCSQSQTEGYICTGATGGGGPLASAVNATDGSIGYVDLATARSKGFVVSPTSTPSDTANHQYWVPLQAITGNGSTTNGPYQEPTFSPDAHQNGSGASGANCANANYRGIPSAASSPNGDPSEGDWSNAIATGSRSSGGGAYPVCVLTYELAFDDNATVFRGAGEEGQARTVKDYLVNITSNAGQALTGTDYATLPLSLTTIAQNGVKAIDWNKAANQTGGGGGTTTNPNPGGGGSQGGATTAGGGPSAPSNEFSLLPVRVSGGRIVVGLSLPGPGQVHIAVSARFRGQSFSVRDLVADVGGGQGSVSLIPSARTLSVLKKAKRLGVSVTVTYTPSGGSASTKSETGTLVQGKSAKHKKHKKHKKHHKAKHPKHPKKK